MTIASSSVGSSTAELRTELTVIRRDGSSTPFDASKISVAVSKAFLAVEGADAGATHRVRDLVADLTGRVVAALTSRGDIRRSVQVEDIQDQVELALMRTGEHQVARAYVLYREERTKARTPADPTGVTEKPALTVRAADGSRSPLDVDRLRVIVAEAATGLDAVDPELILNETLGACYDGIAQHEVELALVMAARSYVETEPQYSFAASRLLLDQIRREALGRVHGEPRQASQADMTTTYVDYFPRYIQLGIEAGQLDPELGRFDLERLAAAIKPEADLNFTFLSLQTLYDRYLLHLDKVRYELPQAFFLRVAMGMALREDDREARAIEFYELLSSFRFMSSTPTLFNSGTTRPQLSSCFLTTVEDDLSGIFTGIRNNALLAKYSGGLGNDWTPVRGIGAHIRGTNGESQGVVPFLKIANDTAVAVNQCFAPETLLYTATGATPIRDVKVGDLVLGASGRYREVTKTFTYDQDGPMVEVDVKHSIDTLVVTSGHPFYAIQGVPMEQSSERTLRWISNGKVKAGWVEAGMISKGDYIGQVVPDEIVPVRGLTDDDARLYGILLGDGHLSKNGNQWGVSGNPKRDTHLSFVRAYLAAREIHFWETQRGDTYVQIHWSAGRGPRRDPQTGRIAGPGDATLPFTHEDLYDENHSKRIAPRLTHLPIPQTLALVRGLLETDGGVSRGKEIYFTSTSQALAIGLRYQMLRLGIPTAGQYRVRDTPHIGRRSDGSEVMFSKPVRAFDLRIPAVPGIAELVGAAPIQKLNWISHGGMVFSRVREVRRTAMVPVVHDLVVDVDESYMTVAGLAHNGGKRKGAVCAYLETWHIDVEEFLDLRKNTGDERRRTHDMNTANWVPDLFLQRVESGGDWTLFSPNEVPDLHDLYGAAFAEAYAAYEAAADRGEIRVFKRVKAVDLWRRMLTVLFETGHPWITFKDACNLRSPQQHDGVVHSSNLCTEITLNTTTEETAVCNLGSVNLIAHLTDDGLDTDLLRDTVKTAVRMLDNVIDVNFYTTPESERANQRHRPVGLGLMGFADALFTLRIPYASDAAVEFADRSMEQISYHAIEASSDLAAERGRYSSYDGSLWSLGILPIDSLDLLHTARDGDVIIDRGTQLDWDGLRAKVLRDGMRNSNVMAIAPTATISNICGVSQSIEPTYSNLFVKSNMSGEFTVANPYLVADLKARGLWDQVMVSDLKYHDGVVAGIERIPADLRELYATAFEIDPLWLVKAASRRQKWIDQAQSLNLYMAKPSGRALDELYRSAWRYGLKTTYYLRSQSATHVEKSTLKGTDGRLNAVPVSIPEPTGAMCSIDDPDCEACQ
ncbi:ribonucleoside-diphosphate reductase subunit alpha [Kribbella sp. VKM Ac-2569]|uniref:ribonucleoside-diphosphate reductase subunit alpha n=1 Tax=Kribbella sp. VKM Ac-2569 TaxID=2512220 RepID=UPI001F53F46D|nr:ribonucleoside-diphosphate reductase subunit alpha [Kribbella sp. VKM Ac-2569]